MTVLRKFPARWLDALHWVGHLLNKSSFLYLTYILYTKILFLSNFNCRYFGNDWIWTNSSILQNRFKEKIADRPRPIPICLNATVTPRFHIKLDTYLTGWTRTNNNHVFDMMLFPSELLAQLGYCFAVCVYSVPCAGNFTGWDAMVIPLAAPPRFHHSLLNFYSAPIATGAFRLVLLKG